MGFLCCWNQYLALVPAFLGLLALIFRRKSKGSDDKETLDLLTLAEVVPPECRPCITSLLACPITDNEAECAEQMRNLLKEKTLPYESLAHTPELLLGMSRHTGDGDTYGALWTRFTVQFNLFAGSIVALGTQDQREKLYATQASGDLGCFAFTEAGAGVLSGAAVETTAVYDASKKVFVINSPTETSKKRWISQGNFAEHAVISANLLLEDGKKNAGPHLFFARIQRRDVSTGVLSPLPGVTITSVPVKTTLRGLDNAIIAFDSFEVDHCCLLSRFSSISLDGTYSLHLPKGVTRMLDLLITRLLTGRVVLSEYTVSSVLKIMRHNWSYACSRELWRGKKPQGPRMSELPIIKSAFVDYGRSLALVKKFIATTRDRVVKCIKTDKFENEVIESTCISKFVGTGFSVDTVSMMRKLMASQALFQESWLGETSFVCNATCAAEGDNTIMELKIVQDLFRGRTSLFPVSLLLRSLRHTNGRRVVFAYLARVARAMWLREKALNEGQLLKDIAWCRAHLLIMDCWVKSKGSSDWLDSYGRIMIKFPMPVQC